MEVNEDFVFDEDSIEQNELMSYTPNEVTIRSYFKSTSDRI